MKKKSVFKRNVLLKGKAVITVDYEVSTPKKKGGNYVSELNSKQSKKAVRGFTRLKKALKHMEKCGYAVNIEVDNTY